MSRPGRARAVRCLAALAGLLLWLVAPGRGDAQDQPSCAAPAPVCAARAAVFAVSAFDPLASAVRIGPDLLVTNRHVVADETRATIVLDDGRRLPAAVVPSGYPGDLVLLRAEGLGDGPILTRAEAAPGTVLHTVGVALDSGRVRAYPPGRLVLGAAPGKPLARLYHSAHSQPGNSGGALVDARGRLLGIVASGGAGNNEAIPAAVIATLRAQSGAAYREQSRRIGAAYRACGAALERAERAGARLDGDLADTLERACGESGNRQLLDLAGQALGRSGRLERALGLFEAALERDPHAINARLGLVVTLQLGRRYAAAVAHLDRLLDPVPDNLQVLHLAVLSGKWGDAPDLAARALALIETHHPLIAPSARKFLNSDDRPAPAAR